MVTESISGYFPDLEHRDMNAWIVRRFIVEEKLIKDKDVKAKAESLSLRKAGLEYPIVSDRALELLTQFATTYRCETGFLQ